MESEHTERDYAWPMPAGATIQAIDGLIAELKDIEPDPEAGHIQADRALLRYINDERVTELHRQLAVWYA